MPSWNVNSNPATGDALATPAVTFAIPPEVGALTVPQIAYCYFTYHHTRSYSGATGADDWGTRFLSTSDFCNAPEHFGNGTFNESPVNLSALMVADLIAAAGGNLTINLTVWSNDGSIPPARLGDTDLWDVFVLNLGADSGGAANRKDVIVGAPQLGAVQYGVVRS